MPKLLTDEQVDEIRAGVEAGERGPRLVKWIRQLLEDLEERKRQAAPR